MCAYLVVLVIDQSLNKVNERISRIKEFQEKELEELFKH